MEDPGAFKEFTRIERLFLERLARSTPGRAEVDQDQAVIGRGALRGGSETRMKRWSRRWRRRLGSEGDTPRQKNESQSDSERGIYPAETFLISGALDLIRRR